MFTIFCLFDFGSFTNMKIPMSSQSDFLFSRFTLFILIFVSICITKSLKHLSEVSTICRCSNISIYTWYPAWDCVQPKLPCAVSSHLNTSFSGFQWTWSWIKCASNTCSFFKVICKTQRFTKGQYKLFQCFWMGRAWRMKTEVPKLFVETNIIRPGVSV